MTDNAENNESDIPAAEGASSDKAKRFRSEIEFPYADLESAVELATTVHSKAGASCAAEELAAWMDQSASGGTFRSRLSAARIFGLVDTGQHAVTLTQLGRDLANKGGDTRARAEAFLSPELYSRMYDQHKGNALPPPAAIERQMEQLGVSPKQKDRARQVFMKSATYAGFVDPGSGRFIKPGNGGAREEPELVKVARTGGNGGGNGGGSDGLDLDPLLTALLKKLPAPELGWPAAQRVRWFRTFAMNVSQIYDGENDPVELEIKALKADDVYS